MNTLNAADRLPGDLPIYDTPYDVIEQTTLLLHGNFDRQGEIPPEHRLLTALLRDSIRCIERYRHARDTRGKRIFAREASWMLSDDTDWLCSFARVCEVLDLDRGAVRRSLGLLPESGGDTPVRDTMAAGSALQLQ